MIGWPIFRFLSFPIAFLLPGYHSFKAVLSSASDDDTRWLSYWMIYSFLYFFETVCKLIIASFPFYYELKCVFLVMLQWDTAILAHRLYKTYVEPIIKKYQPHIDGFLNKYSQQAVELQKRAQALIAHAALQRELNSQ